MTGLPTPYRRTRAVALATLALLALPATAGRAEQPAASTVAAAFADLGPAQTEPFAQGHAVDVTEVAPAPIPAEAPLSAQVATMLDTGMASYYGRELAGNRTASGEAFDPTDLTAAHRTLPFGTRLRVTNQRTGLSVIVRVNDRGPYARGRVLDISHAAAQQIGMVRTGHAPVSIELVQG
ncbi:septal ring lytic transglycosylase RlpA family protein [Alteraurantiacibacter buctensis]|uniref:Endolytic peptidoglycan transglycosylase RlpA n=1 Tax=Alteraurantiacibacter buctensis TaxID=1503981 RepID=A0A844YY95_9SPHN|nr:septal ring lytic transglycosylase RlpA family protein [Alteraurantiacibacter buctensis]MXO71444.1 septal ring lytic transglycosylase RlpA family protein [Alteraurantiacibacter buctensis]